jgi:2-dehydropantoate 2-reductase
MRIAVFGPGGVGAYFGGRLAQAGENVFFIARGSHLRAIRDHGLHVNSVKGDFVIRPAQAGDDPTSVGKVDVVIAGVKAWQVPEAARAMVPLIGPESFVLPLQNGVEAPEQFAAVLGREHVIGGLARIFSFIVEPGRIRHFGGPAAIAMGELDNQKSERVERLGRAFFRAGISAEVSSDIQAALWEKFLFVTPFSGIGAATRAPWGIPRALPETRRLLEQGMDEIFNVARALQVPFPGDVITKTLGMMDRQPPDLTTSMQRDVIAGRPSELEALTGAVVRFGKKAGVATPLHSFLYSSLLPLELQSRGKVQFPV